MTCIVCKERPAIGVGHGKMKQTCAECTAQIVAKGGCALCHAERVSQEHRDECTRRKGKQPAKPKMKAPAGKKQVYYVDGKPTTRKPPSPDTWVPDLI